MAPGSATLRAVQTRGAQFPHEPGQAVQAQELAAVRPRPAARAEPEPAQQAHSPVVLMRSAPTAAALTLADQGMLADRRAQAVVAWAHQHLIRPPRRRTDASRPGRRGQAARLLRC